jgi:hypothetical protein
MGTRGVELFADDLRALDPASQPERDQTWQQLAVTLMLI